MEDFALTTPITFPSLTSYRVTRVEFDWTNSYIGIYLTASNGERLSASYTGVVALSLMTALNKANLSTTSLHRRILERLATDGKLPAGSVSGSPD